MTAATTTGRSHPRGWWLSKMAVVGPDLIISSMLWIVLLAALPADMALGWTGGLLVMSLVVASGRAEGLTVGVLHATRRPTAEQGLRLAGPLQLVAHRAGQPDLRVRVGGTEPVSAAGRRHVLLHRSVLDAHHAGRITDAHLTALIAHGVGRLHHSQPRLDLLVVVWTTPWDFVRGLVIGVGRHLSWVPLVRFAWRTRFVTASIAVVLEAQAGRWPSPIIIAVFIALSYLLPAWRRAWLQLRATTADQYAHQLQLDTIRPH